MTFKFKLRDSGMTDADMDKAIADAIRVMAPSWDRDTARNAIQVLCDRVGWTYKQVSVEIENRANIAVSISDKALYTRAEAMSGEWMRL